MDRHNEKVLAEIRSLQAAPEYLARAGRLDKWKQLAREARDMLPGKVAAPERLSTPVHVSH